jgi:localization factor PodJL
MLKFLKTLLIASSVAIIAIGTVQTAIEFLFQDDAPTAPIGAPVKDPSKRPSESMAPPEPSGGSAAPGRAMPSPQGALPAPATPDLEPTNSIGKKSLFDPTPAIKLLAAGVTGSIPHKPAPTKPPAAAPDNAAIHDTLPAALGPALRTAALANEPGAEYEVGARYAEGRTVPQNWYEAARWFQKAADAGFAPAQFRLASLKEKGQGGPKDVQAARRLYIAAAEKGHAKAMHNLAVLYAEGVDGKPDYKVAAEWFLKAAMYGVTDSQFNLAILYARGIGVPANLAESYRWFAMAASTGDADAARKRDEVAARLDAKTLAAAKLAVQRFVPEREPEEAVSLKAPPGGWDRAPAHPARARRHVPSAAATR